MSSPPSGPVPAAIRFFITGARAPSALQLARILGRSGHHIVLADSMSSAASYRSKWIQACAVLPPPASNFREFFAAAKQAIAQYQPDVILCTCEEIFYWAKAAELAPEVFAPYFRANPPFKTLRALHDKAVFARLAKASAAQAGVLVPETKLRGTLGTGPWVCKPAFSRFATQTRLGLSASAATEQLKMPGWLAQKQVSGREFCTWAWFIKGHEVASAAYEPIYRAGQGSGIGLSAREPGRAAEFARVLAARLRYTGQLAFDWIENDSGCSVLECNPRSTSGIHFLDRKTAAFAAAFSQALSGDPFGPVTGETERVAVKWAMLMFGTLSMLRPKSGAAHRAFFREARDVERDPQDPKPSAGFTLLRSLTEIIARAIRNHSSLISASTADIEWNGNEFWRP